MKTALIFYGGWEGHHPLESTELWTRILEEEGFAVNPSESLDDLIEVDDLLVYDLLIPNWTAGELSRAQEKGLAAAVSKGCGLGGWHGMADGFRNNPRYQFMVGGQWVAHPGNIRKYAVKITNQDHPITEGIEDFEMESEQYYLHTDPGNTVLATTTFLGMEEPWIEGAVMPAAWTRRWGEGNVFYCSLGHQLKDFEVPECREIIRRGLLWAARKEGVEW